MKQEIAQRLAARRKRAGLSQESLAAQLGVSRQAVSKWECGECAPDTENLIALSMLYEVSLDDLLWKDVEGGEANGAAANVTDGADGAEPSTECDADGVDVSAVGDAGRDAVPGDTLDQRDDVSRQSATEAATGKGAAREADPTRSSGEGRPHTASSDEAAVSAQAMDLGHGRGESVRVSWRDGVHVVDPAKGEEVHVGWDGIRVKSMGAGGGAGNDAGAASGEGARCGTDAGVAGSGTAQVRGDWFAARDGSGHTFETDGSTVVVDGVRYDSWRDAHRAHGHRRDDERLWKRFPFPLLVGVTYVFLGVLKGLWIPAVFLFFLIPLYYLVGNLVETRGVARFVEAAYPIGTAVFFLYMTLIEGAPHPAWLVFLTIPLVEAACVACSRWWQGRSDRELCSEGERGE